MDGTLFRVEAWDSEGRLIRHTDCVRRREAFRLLDGVLADGLEAKAVQTRCDALRRRSCARQRNRTRRCPI